MSLGFYPQYCDRLIDSLGNSGPVWLNFYRLVWQLVYIVNFVEVFRIVEEKLCHIFCVFVTFSFPFFFFDMSCPIQKGKVSYV